MYYNEDRYLLFIHLWDSDPCQVSYFLLLSFSCELLWLLVSLFLILFLFSHCVIYRSLSNQKLGLAFLLFFFIFSLEKPRTVSRFLTFFSIDYWNLWLLLWFLLSKLTIYISYYYLTVIYLVFSLLLCIFFSFLVFYYFTFYFQIIDDLVIFICVIAFIFVITICTVTIFPTRSLEAEVLGNDQQFHYFFLKIVITKLVPNYLLYIYRHMF